MYQSSLGQPLVVSVPLTKGFSAIIDECDVELVGRHAWCVREDRDDIHRYAVRGISRNGIQFTQSMHQLIMGCKSVDHINGDGLDNRRINLRVATRSQNMGNTLKRPGKFSSQFKGVKWSKSSGKWTAEIVVDGVSTRLGRFADEAEAGRAYDRAAREGFKEFAALNFPLPGERSALVPMSPAEVQIAYSISKPERVLSPNCRQGHPYTAENTYVDYSGRRHCRTCRAAHGRVANERRKMRRRENVS